MSMILLGTSPFQVSLSSLLSIPSWDCLFPRLHRSVFLNICGSLGIWKLSESEHHFWEPLRHMPRSTGRLWEPPALTYPYPNALGSCCRLGPSPPPPPPTATTTPHPPGSPAGPHAQIFCRHLECLLPVCLESGIDSLLSCPLANYFYFHSLTLLSLP